MILSDKEILAAFQNGIILIEPFDRECLGTNSYDVHLGKFLATYEDEILDAKAHNKIATFEIPEEGFILMPNTLYLGVTEEYTETLAHVPFLEGKSSVGRLGIDIHATAGKGDVGFCNYWTLELSVKQPVRVYAGMPIGQLIYFKVEGEVERPYNQKNSAKYNERSRLPVESMMWKNFAVDYFKEENEFVKKSFDLEAILAFTLEKDVQIIRGEDYQYMCCINKDVYATALTPMFALLQGVRCFKKCGF